MADAAPRVTEDKLQVGDRDSHVSTIELAPPDPVAWMALAHGAGAGMRHAAMEAIAALLAERGIATLRYQFPYMEQGRRGISPRKLLLETVCAAAAAAAERAGGAPLLAGGKSMGGRMTSLAAAEGGLPGVRGIVFFGFPLHAAGKPSSERGDHLASLELPLLFLQGTRDKLAKLELLRPICSRLPDATLVELEGADHSFHVLKRSGRTDDEVLDEMGDHVTDWLSHGRW